MRPIDKMKQARTIVSERLRLFFDHWKLQSASVAEEAWENAAIKLSEDNKEP